MGAAPILLFYSDLIVLVFFPTYSFNACIAGNEQNEILIRKNVRKNTNVVDNEKSHLVFTVDFPIALETSVNSVTIVASQKFCNKIIWEYFINIFILLSCFYYILLNIIPSGPQLVSSELSLQSFTPSHKKASLMH